MHRLNLSGASEKELKQLLKEKEKETEELKSSLKKVHKGIKFGKVHLTQMIVSICIYINDLYVYRY